MLDKSTLRDEESSSQEMLPDLTPLEALSVEVYDLKDKLRYIKWAFATLAFISVVVTSMLVFKTMQQERFVMFNVKGTTNDFLKQVSQLNIDDKEKKKLVARYQKNLTDIIKGYQEQGIIVLSSSAIMTRVEDKTPEIKTEIAKRMKNKQQQDPIAD